MADSDPWVDSDEEEVVEQTEESHEEEASEQEEEVEKKEEKKPWRPKGMPEDERWDPIEFSEEQQKRVNRLYASAKFSERSAKEAAQTAAKLAEQNKRLSERLNALETKASKKDYSDRLSDIDSQLSKLSTERAKAYSDGNEDLYHELSDQIVLLKLEKKNAKEPVEEKKQEEEKEEPKEDINELPEETVVALREWANETDKKGNLLRPWFFENHPDHQIALKIAERVLGDDDEMPIDDILAAVQEKMDAYYGKQKVRRTPDSIDARSEKGAGRKNDISLSNEQVHVARKMFPNSKDPIGEYKAALSSVEEDLW